MRAPTSKIPAAFVLLVITLMAYLLTLCPTVYLGDSGELSAAAFCLGVPHGSGYPIYALLGKVFCLIPVGNVGFRMNLLSAFFGVLTVGVMFSLILRMTDSRVGAFTGAGVFAFIPIVWWQTVAAEVYAVHAFFVVMMVWLLWRWEETREYDWLVVFALVTGLSFCNHLQTVMLAPGVFYLILSGDRKVLLDGKRFLVLGLFLVLPLLVYLYLPIRTSAGAAIHWGDPDSWDRFWAHVSGRSHRGGYVFNLGVWGYVDRLKESFELIWAQFGVMVLVGVWGWWRVRLARWRVFFVGVVVFDLFYTVFLNTVSLEITPFNLSTLMVLAVLIGVGVAGAVKACERHGDRVVKVVKVGGVVIPLMFLVLNYRVSDQSRNYTAYEHALNIFRTVEPGDTILVEGDNNSFPLIYGWLAEKMGEQVALRDGQNLVSRRSGKPDGKPSWETEGPVAKRIVMQGAGESRVFFAVFDSSSVAMPPSHEIIPYGLLQLAVKEQPSPHRVGNMWRYYSMESFYESFHRDFMNRQIYGHFKVRLAQHLFASGNIEAGKRVIGDASREAFDDYGVHLAASAVLIHERVFDMAKEEIEKAGLHGAGAAIIHNSWGCYYFKKNEYEAAVESFRISLWFGGRSPVDYKNLLQALEKAGRLAEAVEVREEMTQRFPGVLEGENAGRQGLSQ